MFGRRLLLLRGFCSHFDGFQRGDDMYCELDYGSSHP
jgi:hypothetical protein